MTYNILIERCAQKSLAKIAKSEQRKIIGAIQNLGNEPRPYGVKN